MNRIRVRGIVSGKVQGVFYRASAKTRAEDLGLSGWVRNNPDGTVQYECQGPDVRVLKFLEWSREGPDWAKVESLNHEEIPLEIEQGFNIVN